MATVPRVRTSARDKRLIGGIGLIVFLAHMLVSGRYGYFVDELYYLACSHHLAWGYVDQPPLIAVITWLERVILGDSLTALHFLPAVAAGLRVVLTGYIARELGARRFAIALSCVCVAVAPLYLGLDSLLTMNVFESLFWMGAALVALKIFNGGDPRLWILFGVICGVGLLNKHSMLFFGFGLAAGLLLTKQRKQLDKPWIWLGALVALLIFLPNLIWEIQHHFPTIELLQNVQRSGRNTELNPLMFMLVQMFIMHPLAAPVWIAGLIASAARSGREGLAGARHYVPGHYAVHAGAARKDVLSRASLSDAVCGGWRGDRSVALATGEWPVAETCVHHAAGSVGHRACAIRVLSVVERQSIHRLFEIHASATRAAGESPDGPVAANLCRPVWLERNGAGGG